ncbi:hypothetical protein ACOME3_007923 [Neoechinorhynchus agilis]
MEEKQAITDIQAKISERIFITPTDTEHPAGKPISPKGILFKRDSSNRTRPRNPRKVTWADYCHSKRLETIRSIETRDEMREKYGIGVYYNPDYDPERNQKTLTDEEYWWLKRSITIPDNWKFFYTKPSIPRRYNERPPLLPTPKMRPRKASYIPQNRNGLLPTPNFTPTKRHFMSTAESCPPKRQRCPVFNSADQLSTSRPTLPVFIQSPGSSGHLLASNYTTRKRSFLSKSEVRPAKQHRVSPEHDNNRRCRWI